MTHPKTRLVDIINLNADASCLSTKRWMNALNGGKSSELYRLLESYVIQKCKINLGIIGSTLAEIQKFNPECISLINNTPEIFEILIRPFIHSLSILWSDKTFQTNYVAGEQFINKTFNNTINWYLPPEFALRNSQLHKLKEIGCEGSFIHPKRIKTDLKQKYPNGIISLKAIQQTFLDCIVFTENFDSYYVEELQQFKSSHSFDMDVVFGWRDGESPFFLPDSVERESAFISSSSKKFERLFLSEYLETQTTKSYPIIKSYPQNSLLPWLGNFRLFWYITEVKNLELIFESLSKEKKTLYLNLLNSDILSSTEKDDVSVLLLPIEEVPELVTHRITRKERNLEAEELLFLIKDGDINLINKYLQSDSNSAKRISARFEVLNSIVNPS